MNCCCRCLPREVTPERGATAWRVGPSPLLSSAEETCPFPAMQCWIWSGVYLCIGMISTY